MSTKHFLFFLNVIYIYPNGLKWHFSYANKIFSQMDRLKYPAVNFGYSLFPQ